MDKEKKSRRVLIIIFLILVIAAVASVCMGRYPISFNEMTGMVKDKLLGVSNGSNAEIIMWQVRIPRIIVSILIGVCLSLSGAAYQGVFRNPMVSPDILGASAGAGFGAALGLLLGFSNLSVQIMAFVTGSLAVLVAWWLNHMMGGFETSDRIMLILSGIITGALFQALISIVKYVADPFDTMPSIAFWLMGGLNYVTESDVTFLLIPLLLGGIPLILIRWRLNLMAFDSDEARALGININNYRTFVIVCSTLMTAACVAVGGMIGWVGLIVPHFARIAVGPDYKHMLPVSGMFGGLFMLIADDIARCMFSQEIPIGILTALVGAPVFAILLIKTRKRI